MISVGLGGEFGRLGVFVGRHPVFVLLFALALSVPGLLGLWFRFELDPLLNGGFVPSDAPSHREIADQQNFFGAHGLPWYMALFAESEKNLLDFSLYKEFNDFHENTTKMDLSIDGGRTLFRFGDLCHPLCGINEPFKQLMGFSLFATIRYPVSEVLGVGVNIGKHIFDRTVDGNGTVTSVRTAAFYYTSLITDEKSRQQLELFERTVARLVAVQNSRSANGIRLTVHGTNTVGQEIQRGFQEIFALIAIASALASLVFLGFVWTAAWFRSKLDCRRLFLGMVALILAPLALANSCGFLCWVGVPINMLFVIAPIGSLVFLSHLQNVLFILSTFDDLDDEAKRNQYNRSERMGALFEQMAPTYLTNNLGLVGGFGGAGFLAAPSYAHFGFGLAASLLFLSFLELTVFSALLSFSCDSPQKVYESPQKANRTEISYSVNVFSSRFLLRPYSAVLSSVLGRLLGFAVLLLFLGFPVHWGIRSLRSEMDFRRFLPEGSPAIHGFDIMDNIWKDFHQMVFIINRSPDFTNPDEYRAFRRFISEMEAIPNALPADAQMSWIFDYYRSELGMEYHTDVAAIAPPNMTNFHQFITTFPFEAWKDGIRFSFANDDPKKPKIRKMVVMGAFHNMSGLSGKRDVIVECRRVAQNNAWFEISAFDTDSRTADIMDNVLPTLHFFFGSLLISSFVLPLLTLWNLAAAVLSAVGMGFVLASGSALSSLLLDLRLDLFSATMLTVSVGMGSRVAAHFVGNFLCVWAHEDRTARALQNGISVILKTFVLAALQILPLIGFGTVPLFVQHGLVVLLVMGSGVVASVFVLPLIASLLPTRMISLESCC